MPQTKGIEWERARLKKWNKMVLKEINKWERARLNQIQ